MLEKIFSFKLSVDGIRYKLVIFGIKISFPRLTSIINLKASTYYKYKKENRDITTLPKATGRIRDVQLANFEILKEFDNVCKKNNLKYWLYNGTLLGAVRHKGFIPWDDDIDVSMMREDFNKLLEVFEQTVNNKDLYLRHHFNEKGMYLLKIGHKKCPYIFVDVFIFDYCKKTFSDDEKIAYTKEIQQLRADFVKNFHFDNGLELYNGYKSLIGEIQKGLDLSNPENLDLLLGLEYGQLTYSRNNWIMPYSDVFPLKEIEFEGVTFPAVNDTHNFLTELYGNYMGYPKKIDYGHSGYIKLTPQDKEVIECLINKKLEENIV